MAGRGSIHPPTWLFLAIGLQVALHLAVPGPVLLAFPWSLASVLLVAGGLSLAMWGDRIFKRVETTIRPFETSDVLVTEGPFRFSRHPIYLGFVALLAGVAVACGSLTPWLGVAAFFALVELRFVRIEERMMGETFGEAYEAYRARVPRWIGIPRDAVP